MENLFIGCSECVECSSLLERVMFDETRGVFAYINRTVRCKMARGTIEQEINDHIEDQKEEFLSEGMSQTEAEEAAVREMGDPVEVGLEMDRIHRPTWRGE